MNPLYTHKTISVYAFVLSAVLITGCGTQRLSHTVKDSLLNEVSRAGQLWIYDAENEVVVALDRLDDATDGVTKINKNIAHSEAVEQKLSNNNKAEAAASVRQWVVCLQSQLQWAQAAVDLYQQGVLLALAGLELAKAQVVQREDLVGGDSFSIKDYQQQYDQLKAKYDALNQTATQLKRAARQSETQWWAERKRRIAQSPGGNSDHDNDLWLE